MEKQQSQKERMKLDLIIAHDSREFFPYCSLSQVLVELEFMRAILQRIQKDVCYLEPQEVRILLGKVNGPLTNFTRSLKELNEKAKEL